MRLRTRYTQRLPVAPRLRLDIPFFEGSGTKVLDLSGKGNHGTITDAVWTRDENGVAMSFNGTSAYIDCGNDASLNITDAITIEVWVKTLTPATSQSLVGKTGASGSRSWHVRLLARKINFWISPGGTTVIQANGPTTITDTNWHHVAATWDGTTMLVYIDAVAGTGVSANTMNSEPDEGVYIGVAGSQLGSHFNGTIDEVRIYAVALTADQIKRRYEQTKRDYVRGS